MEMSGEGKQVCVTGASGFIASWLVNHLLLRGYTVNATVRDPSKSDHLVALQAANQSRLRLFKAELLDEGSFDASVHGCDGVFHTASPCFFDSQNPQEELVDPAVKGTMNVLRSCAKFPSVKRVVLTSSMTCMVWNNNNPNLTPHDIIDETWFSDPEYCRQQKRWYPLSKTLAEETAWKYAKEKGIDLVSINPGYVIGPLLQPKINESCGIYFKLINAKTYSNVGYRVVHVKDVADAHIQAFEIESANGRYCLVESVAFVAETLEILRDLYPTLPLPNKCENDTPSRVTCNVSTEKAKSLGIHFIPFRTTLKEMIDSFKENNLISF